MEGKEISAEAYRRFKESGRCKTREDQIMTVFENYGPRMTTGEVFEILKALGVKFPANANIVARCKGLAEQGRLQKVGTKVCESTGEEVTLWELVPGAVKKTLPKKLTHKAQLAQKDAEIAALKLELASYAALIESSTQSQVRT